MNENVPQELVEAGQGYENLFVPALFKPWTKHLIEAADIQQDAHVLDIACGSGILARDSLSRVGKNGRVVGVDPAPGMIATAREIEPAIEWILCGAEALDLSDKSFDCVVSQFGMMFFEDRQMAAREMRRVLKPNGSLAIAVWNSIEHNPAYADIIAVLEDQVGTDAADALRLPFSLGNADEVTSVLNSSGFTNISLQTKVETAQFSSSRQMVEAELRGWLPLFDIHLTDDEINQVLVESDATLSKYLNSSGEAVFPTSAHIISARNPD